MSCSAATENSVGAVSVASIANIGTKYSHLIQLETDTSWSSISGSSPPSSTSSSLSSLPSSPPATSVSIADSFELIRIDHTAGSNHNSSSDKNSLATIFEDSNSNLISPNIGTSAIYGINTTAKPPPTPPTTPKQISNFPKYGKFKKLLILNKQNNNKPQETLSCDEEVDDLIKIGTGNRSKTPVVQNNGHDLSNTSVKIKSKSNENVPELNKYPNLLRYFTVELAEKEDIFRILNKDNEELIDEIKNRNNLYENWKQNKFIDVFLYSNEISSSSSSTTSEMTMDFADDECENFQSDYQQLSESKSKLIPAHRSALCSHSQYFQQFFKSYTMSQTKMAIDLMSNSTSLSDKNYFSNSADTNATTTAYSTFQNMSQETASTLMTIARTSVPVLALPIASDILTDLVKLAYCSKIEITVNNDDDNRSKSSHIERLRKAAKFLKMNIRIKETTNFSTQMVQQASPKQDEPTNLSAQQSSSLSSSFSKLMTTTDSSDSASYTQQAQSLITAPKNRLPEIFKFPAPSPKSLVGPTKIASQAPSLIQQLIHRPSHQHIESEVACPLSPTYFSMSNSPLSSSSMSSSSLNSCSSTSVLPLPITTFSSAFTSHFSNNPSSPPPPVAPSLPVPSFMFPAHQGLPETVPRFQHFDHLPKLSFPFGHSPPAFSYQHAAAAAAAAAAGVSPTLLSLASPSELDQFCFGFNRPPLQSPTASSLSPLFRPLLQRQYSAPANLISVQDLSTMMSHHQQQSHHQHAQQQLQPTNLTTTDSPLALVTNGPDKLFQNKSATQSFIKRPNSHNTVPPTPTSKAISNSIKNRILSRHLSFESVNNSNINHNTPSQQSSRNLVNKQLDYLNAIAMTTGPSCSSSDNGNQLGTKATQRKLVRSESNPVPPSTGLNCRKRYQNLYHAAKYRDRRRQRTEQLFSEKETLEQTQNTYHNLIGSLKTSILGLVQGKTRQQTETGECYYRCPICSIVFLELEKIRQHLIVGHRELVRISVDNSHKSVPNTGDTAKTLK